MFDLRDQLAQAVGAAAKAESLEGSLNSSKDQLLRLTADFENFRKRTVSSRHRDSSAAAAGTVPPQRDQQGGWITHECRHACQQLWTQGAQQHALRGVMTTMVLCCCWLPQADEKAELSSRAKGDVVLGLLPLVDNFELARTQVKAETEAEQKINNSYQVC